MLLNITKHCLNSVTRQSLRCVPQPPAFSALLSREIHFHMSSTEQTEKHAPSRIMVTPEVVTDTPFEGDIGLDGKKQVFRRIVTPTYEFLYPYGPLLQERTRKTVKKPKDSPVDLGESVQATQQSAKVAPQVAASIKSQTLLYSHRIDTPAAVMLKPGLHLIPTDKVPAVNRKEKYAAIIKLLEQRYSSDSYDKCKSASQVFHLERRIKTQIRRHLERIGTIDAKYQHLLLWRSLLEDAKLQTVNQYKQKGVAVASIGQTIYPAGEGQVWLPTNQTYVQDLIGYLQKLTKQQCENVLDIGAGSGVLSFLIKKSFKDAKCVGLDSNPDAVETYNLNAVRLQHSNTQCHQYDVNNWKGLDIFLAMNKCPAKYDRIIANPPWLTAAPLRGDSRIEWGVYDPKGTVLASCLQIMSNQREGLRCLVLQGNQ